MSSEQPDFVRCIFNKNKSCPPICPYYSIAETAYEARQPGFFDGLRKLGVFSDEHITGIEHILKYNPPGLGRAVKFYGLELTECSCYSDEMGISKDNNS